MAAHQAPPSLGFSRQQHWSGLPFPSPMQESESEVAQSCPTLSDPMDCSPPGSSTHGIFQARVLEWGAIAFSKIHTWFPAIHQNCLLIVPLSYGSSGSFSRLGDVDYHSRFTCLSRPHGSTYPVTSIL